VSDMNHTSEDAEVDASERRRVLGVALIPDVQWARDSQRHSRTALSGSIGLGQHVRAERLPDSVGKRVIVACNRRGYFGPGDEPATPQYDELFSFVSEERSTVARPINAQRADRWEPLVKAVALSRLVRPTPVSYGFFARVVLGEAGEVETIFPARFPRPDVTPQPLGVTTGDWLDASDVAVLANLMSVVDGPEWNGLPIRIRRAAVLHEAAATAMAAEERTVLAAAAWDSLTNVGERNARMQFFKRSASLMAAFALPPLDDDTRGDWYSVRSAIVHGQGVSQELVRRYGSVKNAFARSNEVHIAVEQALRDVLRELILARSIHPNMIDDAALEGWLPV
jgi:hypothetical protein